MPTREFLPLFWPEHLLNLAASTSLDTAQVHADLQAMREDYEEAVKPLLQRNKHLFCNIATFEQFLAASSWVSSRAFHVDDEHGAFCAWHDCELETAGASVQGVCRCG
jgi:hypothetical protein